VSNFESKGRVLIIDDDENWQDTIADALESCSEYTFEKAKDSKMAKELLAGQKFDIVTIDMDLKDGGKSSGERLLDFIRKNYPEIARIMISSSSEIKFWRVDKLKDKHGLGAFIHKDELTTDILSDAIEKAKKIIEQEQQKALEDNLEAYLQIRKQDTLLEYKRTLLDFEFALAKQKNIYLQFHKNLLQAQEKAAKFGLDVPIHISHEIDEYKQKSVEVMAEIEKISSQIAETRHKIVELEQLF
jgi:CheY-like chemotaxis protein